MAPAKSFFSFHTTPVSAVKRCASSPTCASSFVAKFLYSPAKDAVDEAETGLKSALAVKIFGPDLQMLENKGKAIKKIIEQVRGIKDVTLVQELEIGRA